MGCANTQRWISRRLDGVLGERFQAPLAEHLAGCEACRAYAEAVGKLDLDLLKAPAPTPGFVARTARRLEEKPPQELSALRRPTIFRPIAAGLGIAAALGGFTVGSLLHFANGNGTLYHNGIVELAAGDAVDPLADACAELL